MSTSRTTPSASFSLRQMALRIVPSVVVLVTALLVLALGPSAVRRISHAHVDAQIVRASSRLSDGGILEQFSAAARDVALVVEPSVVYISTRSPVRDARGVIAELTATGSGWVYDHDGHIISNAHVVDGADRIEVQLHTGSPVPAELVARDLRTDIAVLRVRHALLHPAQRGLSEDVRQGDLVFAFGSPFEFRFSMSSGIVSGLGRSTGQTDILYENYIQVDAAINPGNSGGPLTDARGRVIGMNTAIATSRNTLGGQGQFSGIGLAIPLSMIEAVADKLIRTGEADRGFMGVTVVEFNHILRRALNYDGAGFLIQDVVPGSPADRSGLRRNDVITHLDGRALGERDRIPVIIATKSPGDVVSARLWRQNGDADGGVEVDVEIELDRYDPVLQSPELTRGLREFGLVGLETATMQRSTEIGIPFVRGVLISEVWAGSDADELFQEGATIIAVNDLPVLTLDDLYVRSERVLRGDANPSSAVITSTLVLTVRTPTGQTRRIRVPL